VQAVLAERTAELLATGCFDWRSPHLEVLAADVATRHAHELDPEARARLHVLLDGLAERLSEVAACGVPETLVHGDFHPGNVRGEPGGGGRLVILDWGDAGIGHPLLDQAAFLERVPPPDREPVVALWAQEWRRAVPGCAPERAAHLLAPVAALRQAVIYRYFLDRIEPTERVYHRRDPALWLTRAAELARREASAGDAFRRARG
jgi:Ser/Thr protein kinase RdoA (MazF antagonist)